MACGGLTDDAQYRAFAHGRIVFRDNAHQGAHQQAYADSAEYAPFGKVDAAKGHRIRQYIIDQADTGQRGQYDRSPVAHVQRFLYARCIDAGGIADTNECGAYDGEEDTYACDHHGQEDRGHATESIDVIRGRLL